MKELFVQVKYHLNKGTRDEFYRRFRDNNIREFSRSEEGNLEYDIYFALDDENTVCLFEKWRDEEAQSKHRETLHYAILSELKAKYVNKVEIQRYWMEQIDPDMNVKF